MNDYPHHHVLCLWKGGMITQIAAFVSSFWEGEGSPELVVGSNNVGFDSWQEMLGNIHLHFKRAWCVELCWGCFGCSEQVLRGGSSKMTLVGEHHGLSLCLLLCFCPAFQLWSVLGTLVLKFYTR